MLITVDGRVTNELPIRLIIQYFEITSTSRQRIFICKRTLASKYCILYFIYMYICMRLGKLPSDEI